MLIAEALKKCQCRNQMHFSEEHLLAGHRTQHNTAVMPLDSKGRLSFSHIKKKTKTKPEQHTLHIRLHLKMYKINKCFPCC